MIERNVGSEGDDAVSGMGNERTQGIGEDPTHDRPVWKTLEEEVPPLVQAIEDGGVDEADEDESPELQSFDQLLRFIQILTP